MKAGDRLVERGGGEIGQRLLELAEGDRRLAVQRRIISSPVFFFAIKRETASIFSISSSGCRNATRLMRWSV